MNKSWPYNASSKSTTLEAGASTLGTGNHTLNGRNILLISDESMHPALCTELEARGLVLRKSKSWLKADLSQPERILGAYTWFYEGLRHPLRTWHIRRWLNSHGIPLFTLNQDAPHYLNHTKQSRSWRLCLAQKLHIYDIYYTHTLIDTKRHFSDLTIYLPNAANIASYNLCGNADQIFKYLRIQNRYRWDVTFFGGMNGSRYKEDANREDFFKKLGLRLDGLGISYCFRETAGMTTDEQIDFIQSSRINLNFGARCEYGTLVASGLPERCYGIPASGGFLLCDKRTHARDDFTPGENWAEFDGLEDCVEKIQYWLSNFDKTRDLAESCYYHILKHHTYAHRAEKLVNNIYAWHECKLGLADQTPKDRDDH